MSNIFSILVIDDDPNNFDVIETLLSSPNDEVFSLESSSHLETYTYQLHFSSSGAAAIEAIDIFQPDLILLDIMMPGMDGIEVCKRIKAMPKWKAVPIIVVTALTAKKDLAQSLMAGADDFISKPVNPLELNARIRSMLRIHELNVHLEERVTLRTAQLTATNVKLEQQIQERLLAEAKLLYSESQFRALIENTSDLIILLDSQNLVHYVSPSIRDNLNYSPTEWNRQPLDLWIHPQDQEKLKYLITNSSNNPGRSHSFELQWQHHNGRWITFETIVQHFIDSNGFSGTVVNARDITERMQVETMEQTLKHEKEISELKLKFFSMASHEFRTPLSVILMAAQILENNQPDSISAKQLRNIQQIQSSAKHLNQMLTDILEVARLEAQKMEYNPQPVCVRTLCNLILEPLRIDDCCATPIDFIYVGDDIEVDLDPQLLNSILTNLLTNAVKYTRNNQPIKFQVTLTPEQLEFEISDNGIGIPIANQVDLFNTFHRGDNVGNIKGSGLGLAIVKKCLDLHRGKIEFHSVENRGTTFIVTLPLQEIVLE